MSSSSADLPAQTSGSCSHRGLAVTIVGPDGVGKSTLRLALNDLLSTNHPTTTDRSDGPVQSLRSSRPAREEMFSKPMSLVKLVYLWLDEWLRWASSTRPMLRSGGWVVAERGWWDVVVVPTRYRMQPVPGLHRLLSRFLPLADLLVVLEAPAEVVRGRKDELTVAEIERQAQAWHGVAGGRQRVVFIEAEQPAGDVLAQVCQAIDDTLGEPACPIIGRQLGGGGS